VTVDDARRPAAPDRVGEIWIRGDSVGLGYWHKPEDTDYVFGGRLADGSGPFLRTGDLGWRSPTGDVCITGRSKDVIIIRGQTYYPQDVEATIEAAVPALRPGCSAAFAIERDGGEAVAMICEAKAGAVTDGRALVAAIRAAGGELELSIDAIVVVATGGVPKTASGKVQRALARELYVSGRLAPLHAWERPPR
jgi:acyl-CoA synthetase (AMP-forming)/AMP-acid ligase II